jgi:Phosphodiester glycosidase
MTTSKINRCSFLFLEGAALMRCHEAMNLDGGASRALATNGKIIVPTGRKLTNVIVVYDAKNPAPQSLQQEWVKFQQGA